MKVRWSAGTLALDLAGARVAGAATTAWAIDASFGNPHIQANDIDPGVASGDFAAPHDHARRGTSNTQLSAAVPYSVAAKSLVPAVVEAVVQLPAPLLPVSAGIGGAAADLLYVGAVPAAGLFQVNVRVPANGPTVSAPLVLRFGKATSLPGVTRAIQ